MADEDYNDFDMGYEDEPPEPEIEEGAEKDVENNNNDEAEAPRQQRWNKETRKRQATWERLHQGNDWKGYYW